MAHYLLIYDRGSGTLVRQEDFESRGVAMQARFDAEAEFRGRPNIEIVVLDSSSEAELRRTHGRYFMTLSELAARAA